MLRGIFLNIKFFIMDYNIGEENHEMLKLRT